MDHDDSSSKTFVQEDIVHAAAPPLKRVIRRPDKSRSLMSEIAPVPQPVTTTSAVVEQTVEVIMNNQETAVTNVIDDSLLLDFEKVISKEVLGTMDYDPVSAKAATVGKNKSSIIDRYFSRAINYVDQSVLVPFGEMLLESIDRNRTKAMVMSQTLPFRTEIPSDIERADLQSSSVLFLLSKRLRILWEDASLLYSRFFYLVMENYQDLYKPLGYSLLFIKLLSKLILYHEQLRGMELHTTGYGFILLFSSFRSKLLPEMLRSHWEIPAWGNYMLSFFMRWMFASWLFIYANRYGGKIICANDDILGKGLDKSAPHKLAFSRKLLFYPYYLFESRLWRSLLTRKASPEAKETTTSNKAKKVVKFDLGKVLDTNVTAYDMIHQGRMGTIYMGEWLQDASYLPEGINFDCILDLTNEVEEHYSIVEACNEYIPFPIWESRIPTEVEQFIAVIKHVSRKRGNIYVHCVTGGARSSLAVACILLERNICSTIQQAYDKIRKARPTMGEWDKLMFSFLEEIAPRFRRNAAIITC